MTHLYLGLVFLLSLTFFICLVMFSISDSIKQRKWLALGAILSLITVCLMSLVRYEPATKTHPAKWHLNITYGLDLKGGTQYTIELQGNPTATMRDQAIEVIRNRIDKSGLAEALIIPVGGNRIQAQIAAVDEKEKAIYREQLSKVAKLEFRLVHPQSEQLLAAVAVGKASIPFDHEILPMQEKDKNGKSAGQIVVRRRAELSGKYVEAAYPSASNMGLPVVVINFTPEGRDRFGALTTANVNHRMAIVLDNEVYSAPNITEPIVHGGCQISGGSMTREEAETLSSILQNPLESEVKVLNEESVDPTLGAASIKSGFFAAFIGSLAVVIFTLTYYRLSGGLAVVALVLNIIVLLGLLSQFGFTLTMPGLAGIVLTIGMAVDGNVLIFERIREELKSGKPLPTAIIAGFDKAFSSVLDANVTTVVAAFILFYLGSGPIRGFAITLTLGVLISMFAVLVATRAGFDWIVSTGRITRLSMASVFPEHLNLPFMKYKWVALGSSALLIVICAAVWMSRGRDVYGVDFSGGSQITYSFKEKIADDRIRKVLGDSTSVQYTKQADGSLEILVVRVAEDVSSTATPKLLEAFPEANLQQLSVNQVGAAFGLELWTKSVWALSLGMVCIFLYTSWRFEWNFALGAIVALLHDVVLALGIFIVTGSELSLPIVGAVLTVAGYSINDTIVIFDRIREGVHTRHKGSLESVMNAAINLTLSRTLITSGTTFLSTLALYIFGGPVIHDFAFVLLVGIIVGTYSSIFIASPVALFCSRTQSRLAAAGAPIPVP